jgi:NADP-dependent 3-hydroxy acid dehydrogenase YdfG
VVILVLARSAWPLSCPRGYQYQRGLEPVQTVTDDGVMATVLVTGGTGFLGAHTIARLLTDGHDVRTTVRSLSRRPDAEQMLRTAAAPDPSGVGFFQADLTADAGWTEAVSDTD